MTVPSPGRSYAGVAVPLAALAGWLLQAGPGGDSGPNAQVLFDNMLANAIGGAVLSLIVGGLLVAVGTEYTGRNTDRILRRPGRTFLYGFGLSLGLLFVVFVLAITIIGLLVAIPLLFVAFLAFLIWGQLGYLALGRLVVDEKWKALGVAVCFAFLVGLVPGIGALAGFVVGSMGVGAGFIDMREDDEPPRRRPGPSRGPRRPGGSPPRNSGGQSDRSGGRPREAGRSRGEQPRGGGGQRASGGPEPPRGQGDPGSGTQQPTEADDGWGYEADDESWGSGGGSGGDWDAGSEAGSGAEGDSGWGFDDEAGSQSSGGESESEWGFDDEETWEQSGEEDVDWSTTDDEVEWSSDDEDEDSGWL